MKSKSYIKDSNGEKVFKVCNYVFLVIFCVAILLPIFHILAVSFNDGRDTMKGGITIVPRIITLKNYKEIFLNSNVLNAYKITLLRTSIGIMLSVFMTALAAFALKSKTLPGKVPITFFIFFTMLFNGGLIPYFMLIRNIGLYDNFWVYVIPSIYSTWNIIIMRTFFEGIGYSLEESAKIDGANDFVIFFRIILPLSKPVLAVIALFVGVSHWNEWFTGVYFVSSEELQPMQTLLWKMISTQELLRKYIARSVTGFDRLKGEHLVTAESLKAATTVIAAGPIIMIYPFVQKYFVKGVMIGAIKG